MCVLCAELQRHNCGDSAAFLPAAGWLVLHFRTVALSVVRLVGWFPVPASFHSLCSIVPFHRSFVPLVLRSFVPSFHWAMNELSTQRRTRMTVLAVWSAAASYDAVCSFVCSFLHSFHFHSFQRFEGKKVFTASMSNQCPCQNHRSLRKTPRQPGGSMKAKDVPGLCPWLSKPFLYVPCPTPKSPFPKKTLCNHSNGPGEVFKSSALSTVRACVCVCALVQTTEGQSMGKTTAQL